MHENLERTTLQGKDYVDLNGFFNPFLHQAFAITVVQYTANIVQYNAAHFYDFKTYYLAPYKGLQALYSSPIANSQRLNKLTEKQLHRKAQNTASNIPSL